MSTAELQRRVNGYAKTAALAGAVFDFQEQEFWAALALLAHCYAMRSQGKDVWFEST